MEILGSSPDPTDTEVAAVSQSLRNRLLSLGHPMEALRRAVAFYTNQAYTGRVPSSAADPHMAVVPASVTAVGVPARVIERREIR